MPHPWTPRKHFEEDMARVNALLGLAQQTEAEPLRSDVARYAVAGAVGAMDAYLCDAYAGLLVTVIRGFTAGTVAALPGPLQRETLPVGPLLARRYPARANWALRMAARGRMEKENMLQVGRVKDMFNPFLPGGQKLWLDLIDQYVHLGRRRLTKWRAADMAAVGGDNLAGRRKEAAAQVVARIGGIVQRRHDIVHNGDRPKVAPQAITLGQARAMVRDVVDFVTVLDNHLVTHRIA